MSTQYSKRIRKLGVLTGGGDVPGLNAAIKTLVYRADEMGVEVLGLRAGWEGISYLDRALPLDRLVFQPYDDATWKSGYLYPLNRVNTRSIDRTGGTILRSTRTNPANVRVADLPVNLERYGVSRLSTDKVDLTPEVLANIEFLGLDGLVVIGGDDTLSYGARLAAEGVPVWGIPKTMDNDVPGTDYSIGFQTAISRAAEFIERTRSTIGSHGQTAIFRLFGRDAGFTALATAVATWADRCLIPEVPANVDRLAEFVVQDRHNPSGYTLIVMSEGANLGMPVPELGPADAYGHRKKANMAEFLVSELEQRIKGVRFLPIDLTYILRSGEPDVYDRRMAVYYANLVVNMIKDGVHGMMAGYRDGEFIYTEMPGKSNPPRRVDPADYDFERYRPNFDPITGVYRPQPGSK
jgi:6-phosphofructokinase 1